MSNENKMPLCNCKEIEEKLISLLKDNGQLLQMIRQMKKDKEKLEDELERQRSVDTGPRPDRTGNDHNNADLQSLIQINHGWKRDYEDLQTRYDLLLGEKKLLEDEEKELKERVSELERRQAPLENEIARLASALYNRDKGQGDEDDISCDEQYEILKTQITVYKEDFERERRDREKLHEEKEKLKREVEDAEEIIKKLTTELDACKGSNERVRERIHVRPEDGYLRERSEHVPRHQVQLVLPYAPVMPMSDHRWRMEQHRRGILPRNTPPASFFYGGDVEVDSVPRA